MLQRRKSGSKNKAHEDVASHARGLVLWVCSLCAVVHQQSKNSPSSEKLSGLQSSEGGSGAALSHVYEQAGLALTFVAQSWAAVPDQMYHTQKEPALSCMNYSWAQESSSVRKALAAFAFESSKLRTFPSLSCPPSSVYSEVIPKPAQPPSRGPCRAG